MTEMLADASPRWGRLMAMAAVVVLIFAALTAGDLLTTLAALRSGAAVELNPAAAKGDGIRLGFLILSNGALLLPLLVAFCFGVAGAGRVPAATLAAWPRHVVDVFYISPLDDGARARAPLRLVTAAMTLLAFKTVILVSNSLTVAQLPNPVSIVARLWSTGGLTGGPLYWATYGTLILPCYVAGVGIAAAVLQAARRP